jgi:hypothetical protein
MMKRVFCLLNAAFAMAILDLISHVHRASFVVMLHKYLKKNQLRGYIPKHITCVSALTGYNSLSVIVRPRQQAHGSAISMPCPSLCPTSSIPLFIVIKNFYFRKPPENIWQ